MDIYCPKCCEPCDVETLHEYVAEVCEMGPAAAASVSFDSVYRAFVSEGCGVALHYWKWACEPVSSDRGEALRVLAEVAGDDVDGFASDVADFIAAGLL